MAEQPDADALKEDESGAVDDWLGQEIERDTEVADAALDEADGDLDEAEQIFDQRAEGEQRHDAAYPHPEDQESAVRGVD